VNKLFSLEVCEQRAIVFILSIPKQKFIIANISQRYPDWIVVVITIFGDFFLVIAGMHFCQKIVDIFCQSKQNRFRGD
jgi:hypothetical protein